MTTPMCLLHGPFDLKCPVCLRRRIIEKLADYHIREMHRATGRDHLYVSSVREEMEKEVEK